MLRAQLVVLYNMITLFFTKCYISRSNNLTRNVKIFAQCVENNYIPESIIEHCVRMISAKTSPTYCAKNVATLPARAIDGSS